MLIAYIASAIVFYAFVARRAPIMTEDAVTFAQCEVIELFTSQADQSVSRAA